MHTDKCWAFALPSLSMRALTRRIGISSIIIWPIVLFLLSVTAYSAVFNVSSGDVGGLIASIHAANSNGQENTINLASGIYSLTAVNNSTDPDGPNGLPLITSRLAIQGRGVDVTVIKREITAPPFRIFHVASTGTLTLSGLTITGGLSLSAGRGPGSGGGIFNTGTLTLITASIRNNATDGSGGGIQNENQTVTIDHSLIIDNTAVHGGGGIGSLGGTLTINHSLISGNSDKSAGGGISIGPGFQGFANSLTITNSRISNNSTGGLGGLPTYGRGGGITSGSSGFPSGLSRVTISGSTISGNKSAGVGGGISSLDTWTISNSTISGNTAAAWAGGIENGGGIGLITNTTISYNSAKRGGGIENVQGSVTLVNSTIAHNFAEEGGGISIRAAVAKMTSILVAENTAAIGSDCANGGVLTSLGYNLVANPTGCNFALQPTDLTGDPGLGAFIDDGAPGHGRFALLQTSQAINRGSNNACSSDPALGTDQLGTPRNGPCDIGAVEFYPVVNDLVALANITTAFDPSAVPGGPAGTFRITAEFINTSNQAIVHPFVEVVELTGENLLLNADNGAGGVGARLTQPLSATTPFEPAASSTFEFLIGLQRPEPFTFFVNMLGEPRTVSP